MPDWQEYYSKRLVNAEEAVSHIKSGDNVFFSPGRQPQALGLALSARKEEIHDVNLVVPTPDRDFGWYDPGWEESFNIEIGFGMPLVWDLMAERRCDMSVSGLTGIQSSNPQAGMIDVLLVEISSPDEHGFYSFGQSVWNKKDWIRDARLVLAEVNSRAGPTCGGRRSENRGGSGFRENESPVRTSQCELCQ
jgi:4-hydroxybutyrate CoA-transferase